ncbi:MAG: M28 family peptidase [Ferruginibacter sp.]
MKKLFFIPLSLLCLSSFAQTDLSAKYAGMITQSDLRKHLSIIASAEMEGRETGTEGQRKAAVYIENQFSRLNLKKPEALKSYQQFYPLHKDSVLESMLKVNGEIAQPGKDYLIPISGNENVRFKGSNLVFAGYGIDDVAYNDYSAINVRGKIVVIFLGEPKKDGKYFIDPAGKTSAWTFPGLNKKLTVAAAKGAVGVLVVNPNMESFNQRMVDNNIKSNLYYPREDASVKKLNYALLSHEYAKRIFPVDFDETIKKVRENSLFTPQPTERKTKVEYLYKKSRTIINASNVIGVLEGTDKKDEYVFLTAHYDHLGMRNGKIWYGADDDGSGTCAVIQMAEAFTKAAAEGNRPRRTIVFMTLSGEEKGLLGSEYYSDHPVFPLDKTTVDLNTDMVGRTDTERKTADSLNYVYVIGHDKLSTELQGINEAANNKYTNLVLDYKFDDPNDVHRIYFRSDHYNFARKGVPILFFYDGMLKADYHQPSDTVDKINFALYEKRVRMIFHTAWNMANRDNMLKRDLPIQTAVR